MITLGISQDRYDSGVALARDGEIIFAANEERYSRKKCQGGFPERSLRMAFEATGTEPGDVAFVSVAGVLTPPLPIRMFPNLHDVLFRDDRTGKHPWREWVVDFLGHHAGITTATADSWIANATGGVREAAVRRLLPGALRSAPLAFAEHHVAHAVGAALLAGGEDALILTADGFGDGLSFTAGEWAAGRYRRLGAAGSKHSIGLFYEEITQALGFIPNRHEGKITGLAASGDARKIPIQGLFSVIDGLPNYVGTHGFRAVEKWRRDLIPYHTREDIAAWAQNTLEDVMTQAVRFWRTRVPSRRLCLAGGVFANVKLNQRLAALAGGDSLFVLPNMGDGGLAVGALAAHGHIAPVTLHHVFWGDAASAEEERAALATRELPYECPEDVEDQCAQALAAGAIVAICRGAMEWGPRALGNRSVLARADLPEIPARLNERLQRSDFMPFAPAILAEDASLYLRDGGNAEHAAEFMTVCFDATDLFRRDFPAVVHCDGTVRAQIVKPDSNAPLHRLLLRMKALTGHGVVLNTSFNLHEEPIVRTPAEAVDSFLRANLDVLVLGRHVIRNHPVRELAK